MSTCKQFEPEFVQFILGNFRADFTTGKIYRTTDSKFRKAGEELPRRILTTNQGKRQYYKCHIRYKGKDNTYMVSRIIFILFHRRDVKPGFLIDHVSRISTDDTMLPIQNLRELTVSENAINAGLRSHSTNKFKGITRTPDGKYVARYTKTTDGVKAQCYLGIFDTDIEAARSYDRAVLQEFGDIAVTNFPITDYLDLNIKQRKHNCGYRGVSFCSGKFVSTFRSKGHRYYGGRFETPIEAFDVTNSIRVGLGLQPYQLPEGVM